MLKKYASELEIGDIIHSGDKVVGLMKAKNMTCIMWSNNTITSFGKNSSGGDQGGQFQVVSAKTITKKEAEAILNNITFSDRYTII